MRKENVQTDCVPADQLMPISKVTGLHPCSVSLATIYRWCTEGVLSKVTGETVKLWRTQRGGGWFTTKAAYDRFIRQQNGED